MGLGSRFAQLFGNSAGDLIDSVGKTVDRFVTTDEDKQRAAIAKQEFEIQMKRFQLDAEMAIIQDRQSAREMYQKDSSLQKVFAIVFLVGYLVITGLMIYIVFAWLGTVEIEIPAWAISLVSTVFGAMSSKVNTIVDFLFGGSKGGDDATMAMQENFNAASQMNNQGT